MLSFVIPCILIWQLNDAKKWGVCGPWKMTYCWQRVTISKSSRNCLQWPDCSSFIWPWRWSRAICPSCKSPRGGCPRNFPTGHSRGAGSCQSGSDSCWPFPFPTTFSMPVELFWPWPLWFIHQTLYLWPFLDGEFHQGAVEGRRQQLWWVFCLALCQPVWHWL